MGFSFKACTVNTQKPAPVNSASFELDKLSLSQPKAEPGADVRASLESCELSGFAQMNLRLFRSKLAGRKAEARDIFFWQVGAAMAG